MAALKHAISALALVGCNADTIELRIVIDSPAPGSSAAAFPDLDTVELSIALNGAALPLTVQTFQRGEDIELPNVPYGEDLVVHMIGRVGSNEVAVGRTCPFSVRIGEDPPAPHLYFARTVKWAEFSEPTSATRDGATALTDFAGNALYIGGVDQTAIPLSGIDRFDTMNGVFEQVAQVEPRRNGAAAQLGDGRIVIGGGTNNAGAASQVLEIVDLQAAPDRRVERVIATTALVGNAAPAMTATSDGAVVAFGGSNDVGKAVATIVDIRAVGASPEQRELPRAQLAVPRKQHTVTRLSDDIGAPIIVIGGLDATNSVVATAELYKPLIEEMSPGFAPTMLFPRRDHRAVRLPDGSVLVVGGVDASNAAVRALEIFNFDSGFQVAGTLPDSAGITDFTVTPLPDGGILLAGGRDGANNPVATTFIIRLDPSDGELDVVTTDRLTTPRARHQATLLCDGTVMLVGGTLIPAPAERYNPPSAGRR
jgi:hypothetical protein